MNLTSVTKKTKAEQAHDIIELAIVNCELAPGAVYSEADLAEILDMGRTPVREALVKLNEWVASGRLRNRETIVEGLENAPKAFIGLFEGANIGKQLVRLSGSEESE